MLPLIPLPMVRPGHRESQPVRTGKYKGTPHTASADKDIDTVVAGLRGPGAELVGEPGRDDDSSDSATLAVPTASSWNWRSTWPKVPQGRLSIGRSLGLGVARSRLHHRRIGEVHRRESRRDG
jgi:hypothetical protein